MDQVTKFSNTHALSCNCLYMNCITYCCPLKLKEPEYYNSISSGPKEAQRVREYVYTPLGVW